MNSPRPFFLLPWVAVVLLSSPACISVPDIEPAKAEVRITSPEERAYTNGVLEVRLEVTGHTPERVELLSDGEVLAEVTAPYVYAWDTAGVAEGTHQLVARAVFGEVTFASEAREVVVDRTAPTVVSRTPEPGAQDVWVKSPIQAVFSEPVKVSTLTSESVRLTVGGVEVARTVSVSGDGRTVTVVPATAVKTPNTVALALSESVMDLAGNNASVPSDTWGWTAPRFAPYPLHSSKPADPIHGRTVYVRLNNIGNPVLLLREFDGQSENLFVSRWTGTAWESLGSGLKTSPSDFDINSPSLEIAPNGNPVVAWQEGVGTEYDNHIHVARWTGDTWERLGGNQGILPNRPHALGISLKLTKDGQPLVAFNMDPEDIESGGHVLVYRWAADTWEQVGSSVYGEMSSPAFPPELSLDANDHPAVAFRQRDLKYIHTWLWEDGDWKMLGSAISTTPDTGISGGISLIFNSSNQPSVFWVDRDSSTSRHVPYARTWNGAEWLSLPVPSGASLTSNAAAPTTCLDASRDLLLAWFDYEGPETVTHLYRQSGNSWEEVWRTNSAATGSSSWNFSPAVDADAKGNITLAWIESAADKQHVVIYRLNH